jgi:hypothetical protein
MSLTESPIVAQVRATVKKMDHATITQAFFFEAMATRNYQRALRDVHQAEEDLNHVWRSYDENTLQSRLDLRSALNHYDLKMNAYNFYLKAFINSPDFNNYCVLFPHKTPHTIIDEIPLVGAEAGKTE